MNDTSRVRDAGLFSDDPIDGESQPDLLNRSNFADHVVGLLDRVREHSLSSVLALIGPWGSGKSSLLQMVLRRLTHKGVSRNRWLIAEFNPWIYPDLESLQDGFFTELRGALPSDAKWSEARKKLGDFGKAISPFGKLGALVGVDVSPVIDATATVIGGDRSASATKAAAEEALKNLGQPILMVLDDLDRLTPDELLRVFKLVRFVGRLPNVYYLLCYDERTLLDVLSRTDLVGDSDEQRARDYLEKIVQVRLDLPPLRVPQAAKLFDKAYELVLQRNGISLNDFDLHRLATAYWGCLHRYLDTPRSINRFVAQVDAFYGLVEGEVDFVDYTLITWLRTTHPSVFAMLKEHREALTKTGMPFALGGQQRAPGDELVVWQGRLRVAGVEEDGLAEFIELLALLFLPIRSARENIAYGRTWMDDIGARRGVGHVDYFDRYFTFGIPEDDMPDADIARALQLIAADEQGQARDRLLEALIADTGRTLRKLRALHAAGRLPIAQLLVVFSAVYGRLPVREGVFVSDPRRNMEIFTRDLFRDLTGDRVEVLRRMADEDSGLYLAADVVARETSRVLRDEDDSKDLTPIFGSDAVSMLIELIRARFDQLIATHPQELSDDVVRLLWDWWHLDPAGLVTWIRAQVDEGRWGLLDVLALLVPVGTTISSGRPATQTLGEISLETIEGFFGIEHVLAELSEEIDALGNSPVSRFELEPTWENRQKLVLSVLRAERARRESNQAEPDNDRQPTLGEGS